MRGSPIDQAQRPFKGPFMLASLGQVLPAAASRFGDKTALASGGTIAQVAESLGIMSQADMIALLVPERLTQPVRLSA